jgi:hypothetical protein
MKISTELTAQIADVAIHRPAEMENCILSVSFVSDPENNNALLNAMSMLLLLKERASIEIYAREIEDEIIDQG